MGVIRICAALAVVCVATMTSAQDKPVSRPTFQNAMGLLEVDRKDIASPDGSIRFAIDLPRTAEVDARMSPPPEGALLAAEFAGPGNTFLETIIVSPVKIFEEAEESRTFAMANLLVINTFASLAEAYGDARMLTFAPVDLGAHRGVHVLGTYTHPQLGPTMFRLVGVLPDTGPDALLAIVNISAERMPIRNTKDLDDTFTGWMLSSLVFAD